MHFAGLAVEAQLQRVVAMPQHQRLGADGALHAGHALGLLGAQAQAEAHAVLGDHQAGLAQGLVALVGGIDHLHTMAGVEITRGMVVDIGQVAQAVAGIRHGRLHRLGLPQALALRRARGHQGRHGVAAQLVQHRGGHEPGLGECQLHRGGYEVTAAQLGQAITQRLLGAGGVARRLQGQGQLHLGAVAVFVGGGQQQTGVGLVQPQVAADVALGRRPVELPVPGHVAVAKQDGVLAQVLQSGHGLVGPQPPTQRVGGIQLPGHVDRHTVELALQVPPGQAVAVVQGARLGCDLHVEVVGAQAQHLAQRDAGMLGAVEGTDVFFAAVDEIVGGAAVEVLRRIGLEEMPAAARCTAPQAAVAVDDGVEQLAVMGGHVLHVAHVLVPALDLEAGDAGVDQRPQVGALVVVLEAQHMLVVGDDAAGRIGHGVGQAAFLAAIAAVGTAPGVRMADEALAGIGDAQRAMDEELQRGVFNLRTDGVDLPDVQLTCQHHLAEAHVLQEARLLGRADVGLGAGMQLDGRQVLQQQAHVLHDQRVGARFVQPPYQAAGRLQFVVAQDGVEGDEDAGVEPVRMGAQAGDVGHGVAGVRPGAEIRPADVDGVGAVGDGGDADVGVPRWRQQFDGALSCRHWVRLRRCAGAPRRRRCWPSVPHSCGSPGTAGTAPRCSRAGG